MSESDKTNELDNYGVWVKKPPRTISDENVSDETAADKTSTTNTENKITDAGDNGMAEMEDIDLDAFMDGADFSDGSSSPTEEKKEEPEASAPASSDGTEEVSLDEFLDGGVFEGDDGGSAASAKSEEESKASANPASAETETVSESVPIEDFGSDNDVTVSQSEPAASTSDDGPLDIDLSFDDMPSTSSSSSSEPEFETIGSFDSLSSPAAESSGLTSSSSTNSDGTENIDLSDFGFDINAPESSSEEKTEEAPKAEETSSSTNDDGTENVDLSDFGFDINAPENPAEEKAPESQSEQASPAQETASETAPAPESEPKTDENGMEEISLDDFGFDINAPEGGNQSEEKPAESAPSSEEKADASEPPANEEITEIDDISLDSPAETKPAETENVDLDSLSLDNSSNAEPAAELPESDGIEMSVKADDDMETEQDSASASPSQNFKADDDDFDVDSILGSIEDENGEKSSLASKDDLVKDVDDVSIEEPKTENEKIEDLEIKDIPEEIPDSFDEETASLFADEPQADDEEKTIAENAVDQSEPENLQNDKIAAVTDGKDEEIASSTNAILSQIVSELASLKSEISGLKNEFDEIKSKEAEEKETASEPKDEIPPKEHDAEEPEENTGFFSENGDDDTIALSVDELDNILNSAEMVDDATETSEPEGQDGAASEKEEKSDGFEPSSIEETISSDTDDLLPDYTDDDGEKEEDIFVPKAEEIEEAQSPIDFGTSEDESRSDEAPDAAEDSGKESQPEEPNLTGDDLSIGDFSFDDDDNGTKTEAESQDEIQPDETLSDDVFNSIEPSNPVSPDSSDDDTIVDESSGNEKETVDEPFDFGSENAAETAEEEAPVEVAPENTPVEDNNIAISNAELDNLLAPDPSIDESLTDENLSYLASDKEIEGGKDEAGQEDSSTIPGNLKKEIKSVLSYMDQLLENLPEDKIAEFAQSEQFETYKKLFKELGLDKQ